MESSASLFEKIISNPKFDPYHIFSLRKTFTLKQLKKQYHKKSLRYHPDKGGDLIKFNVVKYAYSMLLDEYNSRNAKPVTHSHHEKKNNYDTFQQEHQRQYQHEQQRSHNMSRGNRGGEFDNKRFNAMFNDNSLKFVNDEQDGYDTWINENHAGDIDENTEGIRKTISNDKFNSMFSKGGTRPKKTENAVIVYKEPEPTYSSKLKFSDVDLSKKKNYNEKSMKQEIGFQDYKDAYTNTDITNVKSQRNSFASIDQLHHERSSISYDLSEKDRLNRIAMDQRKKIEENSRRQRIRSQDIQIKKHFDIVNSLMLR